MPKRELPGMIHIGRRENVGLRSGLDLLAQQA